MELKEETKVAIVAGICLFGLAIISALRGIYLNPVIQAAPAYFLVLHVVMKNQFDFTCRMCPFVITGVTLLVIGLFLI